MGFVQMKFPHVAKTMIIDAVNDKCANCHHKSRASFDS